MERRGKFLLLPLKRPWADAAPGADGRPPAAGSDEQDDLLVLHLGMTGIVTARRPDAHERARLTLDAGPDPVLHFQDVRRFGRLLLLPGGDPSGLPTLASMGPEPLSDGFDAAGFHRALRRSEVAVKTLLLSQRPVAGVGNIYADEALWRTRIHPATPARRLTRRQAEALRDAIREVLRAAIEAQGTTLNDYRTVNGEVGAYLAHLAAYGHEGDPCPRCGHEIERGVVGQRSSFFCPSCQPRPRRRRRRGGARAAGSPSAGGGRRRRPDRGEAE